VCNNAADLDSSLVSIHSKMQELALRRQKAAWALYERKHLDQLIKDVTAFVDSLISPFPAA
jgi:hypothetical protein